MIQIVGMIELALVLVTLLQEKNFNLGLELAIMSIFIKKEVKYDQSQLIQNKSTEKFSFYIEMQLKE